MPELKEADARFDEIGSEAVWRAPRLQHERKPKPSPARTLTPEQLEEANRILRERGNPAMSVYLNECRTEFVAATPEIIAARIIHPSMLEKLTMSDLLARARTALDLTNKRLSSYEQRMSELKAQQDTDVLHQTRLEEYIKLHEKMTAEIFDLLGKSPAPLPSIKSKVDAKKRMGRPSSAGFGLYEVRTQVFPILRKAGVSSFTSKDLFDALPKAGIAAEGVTPKQISAWLYAAANSPSNGIAKAGRGRFEFTPALN